jgi:hypothetical protein
VLQAAAGVEGEEKAGDAVAIISYGEDRDDRPDLPPEPGVRDKLIALARDGSVASRVTRRAPAVLQQISAAPCCTTTILAAWADTMKGLPHDP